MIFYMLKISLRSHSVIIFSPFSSKLACCSWPNCHRLFHHLKTPGENKCNKYCECISSWRSRFEWSFDTFYLSVFEKEEPSLNYLEKQPNVGLKCPRSTGTVHPMCCILSACVNSTLSVRLQVKRFRSNAICLHKLCLKKPLCFCQLLEFQPHQTLFGNTMSQKSFINKHMFSGWV